VSSSGAAVGRDNSRYDELSVTQLHEERARVLAELEQALRVRSDDANIDEEVRSILAAIRGERRFLPSPVVGILLAQSAGCGAGRLKGA
jgi:hypothetical protein